MAINFQSLFKKNRLPQRRKQVYDGSYKTLYEGTDPENYILHFKDQHTLLSESYDADSNTTIRETRLIDLPRKGALCNRISEFLMSRLELVGIDTHYIKTLNMSEQLIRVASPLPFSLKVHHVALEDLAARLNLEEGTSLSKPLYEFYIPGNPFFTNIISNQHIELMQWADLDEIEHMMDVAQRVSDFLAGIFYMAQLRLNAFSLEFGFSYHPEYYDSRSLLLIDALTPDNISLTDMGADERLDGMISSQDVDDIVRRYQIVAERLGLIPVTHLATTTKTTHTENEVLTSIHTAKIRTEDTLSSSSETPKE